MFSISSIVNNTLSIVIVTVIAIATSKYRINSVAHVNSQETS